MDPIHVRLWVVTAVTILIGLVINDYFVPFLNGALPSAPWEILTAFAVGAVGATVAVISIRNHR